MRHFIRSLAWIALLAGCDRPPPKAQVENTSAADGFDNSAASQSIMQPKVIAESAPAPKPTPVVPPSLPSAIVLFAKGAALDDAARAVLDKFVADPALPGSATIVLRGSSDTQGSEQANLATSRRRAVAVRDYLESKGIAADRLSVIALGDRRPVAPNANLDGSDDPAGRARNRRVDIEVLVPDSRIAEPAPAANSAAPVQ